MLELIATSLPQQGPRVVNVTLLRALAQVCHQRAHVLEQSQAPDLDQIMALGQADGLREAARLLEDVCGV